jgi:cytidylate kinase
MAVITLSRQVGSGGDEIAVRIRDLLGYRYFDKQLMVEAATEAGLCQEEIVDFSEERYKVQDFLSRLFRSGPRPVKEVLTRSPLHHTIDTLNTRELDETQCAALVQHTILQAYETGNIVIVGRGGQAILRDKPGVLHVRVIAPLDQRIQRLRAQGMVGIADIKACIAQKDHATAEYLKRFFSIEWNDPALYHLVLNTGLVDLDAAARIIVAAVEQLAVKTA